MRLRQGFLRLVLLLRDVASDEGGPLFPCRIVEHAPPGWLWNPIQRRPEHGGCVAHRPRRWFGTGFGVPARGAKCPPPPLEVETDGATTLVREQVLAAERVFFRGRGGPPGGSGPPNPKTALKELRILMMLIANVAAVVPQELELGTVSHVVSTAVRILL